jgi:hypothetical protein
MWVHHVHGAAGFTFLNMFHAERLSIAYTFTVPAPGPIFLKDSIV